MRGKNERKQRRGRPQRLTEKDLEKIKELAGAGLSLPECASLMGVSKTAVQSLLKTLDLKSIVRGLQLRPKAMSKLLVYNEIQNGNLDIARWFLDRASRLESERSRIALQRAQRKALEQTTNPEQAPPGLPSLYWERVDKYFSHRDDPKPEQTEAGDPGNNTGDKNPGDKGEE